MSEAEDVVLLNTTRAGVAVVTLNRPKVHNAFNPDVIAKLSDMFETLRTADGVSVVLVEGAEGALEAVLATQSGRLEPATITVIERNLALIDRAITESRAAFIQDPASRFLAAQLTRSYGSKLSMLRDLAMLPSGT